MQKGINVIYSILSGGARDDSKLVDAQACDDFYRDATGGLACRHPGEGRRVREANVSRVMFSFSVATIALDWYHVVLFGKYETCTSKGYRQLWKASWLEHFSYAK